MSRGGAGHWLRLTGWVLPILALACCAPSAARAACGDYVTTRAHVTPADPHHPTDLPTPAGPRKPCDGPNCSGRPVAPPVSAPTVVSPVSSEWGWLASAPTGAPPGLDTLLVEPCSPPPSHIASGIYHPPRRAA
jgi:hypothetical protein